MGDGDRNEITSDASSIKGVKSHEKNHIDKRGEQDSTTPGQCILVIHLKSDINRSSHRVVPEKRAATEVAMRLKNWD